MTPRGSNSTWETALKNTLSLDDPGSPDEADQ
jgi:hypothetical protein